MNNQQERDLQRLITDIKLMRPKSDKETLQLISLALMDYNVDSRYSIEDILRLVKEKTPRSNV